MATMRKIQTVSGPKGLVNVYRNPEWEEYVVRAKGAPEVQWYYTDDKDDAISTAGHIAGFEDSQQAALKENASASRPA